MRKLKHQEIKRLSRAAFAEAPKHRISVLVNNVRSAHNVGAILRTADAALVEHVYLSGISPPVSHKMVHKTALGAQETVPSSRSDNPVSLVKRLRGEGYRIAALELSDSPTTVAELGASDFPLLLIVGNELFGVEDELIEESDICIEIPQFGTKQSLNVSVAFGIAIFGIVEQFRALVPPAK